MKNMEGFDSGVNNLSAIDEKLTQSEEQEKLAPVRRRGRPRRVTRPNDDNVKIVKAKKPKISIPDELPDEYVDTLVELTAKYVGMPTESELYADFIAEFKLEDMAESDRRAIFKKALFKAELPLSEEIAPEENSPETISGNIVNETTNGASVSENIEQPVSAETLKKEFALNQVVQIMYQGKMTRGWVIRNISPENKGKLLIRRNVGTAGRPEYQTELVTPEDILMWNNDGRVMPESVVSIMDKKEDQKTVDAAPVIEEVKIEEPVVEAPVPVVEMENPEESIPEYAPIAKLKPEDDPLHEEYEKAFADAAEENRIEEEKVKQNFIMEWLSSFKSKPKVEEEPRINFVPKFVAGEKIKIFNNGKITTGWKITEVLRNGDIYIKVPETGFEGTFRADDVEAWNNFPKLEKSDIKAAENLDELIDLVSKTGGVIGTNSEEYYSPEYLKEAISSLRNGGRFSSIPRTEGLRLKAAELSIIEQIDSAKTIDDLVKIVIKTEAIRGDSGFLTPKELIDAMRKVEGGENINLVTESLGLQNKVAEIMKARGFKYDKVTGDRIE